MIRLFRTVAAGSSVHIRCRSCSGVIRANMDALKSKAARLQGPPKKGGRWVNSSLTELTNKVMGCTSPDMQRIDQLIVGNASEMTASNITAVLYQCSKKRIPLTDNQLEILIKFLQQRNEKMWNKQISNLLYSCRNLKNNETQAHQLLSTIAVKICQSKEGPFTAQAVGNSLYGLQNVYNSSPEVIDFFRALTPKIIACEDRLSPQELCNALFGLKHMTAKTSDMRSLLSFFAQQIPLVEDSFTGQGLANSVCGLESMDPEVAEVRLVMLALADKIRANPQATFTEEGISMAIYSFRNQNSHISEAKTLLDVLSTRLLEMDSSLFSGETVGNLMNGMSKINTLHHVYRNLISRVTAKIEISEDFVPLGREIDTWRMSSNDIFKAFCGLYNLDSDYVEVRQLVTALVDRLNRQEELSAELEEGLDEQEIDSRVLANSLFALRNMQNNRNEVNYLLKWIESYLEGSLLALENSSLSDEACAKRVRKRVGLNPSDIGKSLYGLRSMNMESRGTDLTCAIKDTNLCRVLSSLHRLLLASVPSPPQSMSLEQLSLSLFGLRGLHGSHPEVEALLQFLSDHHSISLQPETLLTSAVDPTVLSTRLARVLFGLQGKLCNGKEGGSAFVELLADILEHPELDFEFSAKSFCISICGLGNMQPVGNRVPDETRRILLGGIVKRAPKTVPEGGLPEEEVGLEDHRMNRHLPSYGLVLQGLSGMSSDHEDVRMALGVLVHALDSLPDSSTPQLDVVTGFRSMANLSSSFEEVREMLGFLNDKLVTHDLRSFSYDDVCEMMVGMQKMHSTPNKVSKVINNMTNILNEQRSKGDKMNVFTMKHFSTILYGLQSSSSSDGATKRLLTELCSIVSSLDQEALGCLTGRQLELCLTGVQNMNLDHPEVQKLWRVLMSAVESSYSKFTGSSIERCLALLRVRTDTGGQGMIEELEQVLGQKSAAAHASPVVNIV